MHSVTNFALGLLAAAAVATASDVVELKKDTFDDFVKANDIVLAECTFLCPSLHCQPRELAPSNSPYFCSLRPLVWSLQGPRPRVRGGRHHTEGEEHQARQG